MLTTALRPVALVYHVDPGHGWIEVPGFLLRDMGLKVQDFSRYSYRHGDLFFLEEDCDALKFVGFYETMYGHKPQFREKHYNSSAPIRRMKSIHG